VVLRLARDRGHRSDQWAAEIDGQVVADAAGLVTLCQLLRAMMPKATSKRTVAGMQWDYTTRDIADCLEL
jgi:hypothetical protein